MVESPESQTGLDWYWGRRSSKPGSPSSMSSRPWVSKSMVHSAAARGFMILIFLGSGAGLAVCMGLASGARASNAGSARTSSFSSPVTAKWVAVGTATVTGGRPRLVTTVVEGPETTTQALLVACAASVVVVKENG